MSPGGTAALPLPRSHTMKTVLVVDDQPDIRRLIRMSLECEPYEVHEAGDGADALRQAESLRPDLILLDVMMPGELDGLAVCRRVRALPHLAHVKVLLLTALGRAQDRDEALRAGADGYVLKPFSPLELLETVERLLPAA